MFKKLVKRTIAGMGYQLVKAPSVQDNTMTAALERISQRGIDVRTVIDVGASNGMWSEKCMKSLPDAQYFLVEAQSDHETSLVQFKQKHSNADFQITAAGHRDGHIYFEANGLFGGIASDRPFESNCIEVPVTRIDSIVKSKNLRGPFLLKLDTHGFELPILEGAQCMLDDTQVLVIEAYNFVLQDGSLRFWDLCSYMENKGFIPIDLVDLMLRPGDLALWQMDIFFERADRPEFRCNEYTILE